MSQRGFDAGAFREGNAPPKAGTIRSGATCKMCSMGTIMKTKVYRTGKVGARIGYLLFALPVIWAVLFISFLLKPAPSGNELEKAVGSFGDSVAGASLVCFGFIGFVAALLGWFLVMKKEVLKCTHCGVEVPRSVAGA